MMSNFIQLPASKSIGARFLTASYFAGTLPSCRRFDDCDDLKVIQNALDLLFASRHATDEPLTLDIHASGTAFRFMAATIASTPGADVVLTGTKRLCSRPMTPLLEVLRAAGARIEALGGDETGPYRIKGARLKGGRFEIRGDVSSQFISALMLAAPGWEGGMDLRFTTPLVSRPYAEMTAKVMRDFGIAVELSEDGVMVKEGNYVAPADYVVEADWSAAGFIYEAASFMLSTVEIESLMGPEESMQGDAATAGIYRYLGVVSEFHRKGSSSESSSDESSRQPDDVFFARPFSSRRPKPDCDYAEIERYFDLPDEVTFDMTDHPDLVPALAVSCVFNAIRFRFTGVRNLRLKESDRLEAIRAEMEKFGYHLNVEEDAIAWTGGAWGRIHSPEIETYDDHRIAMAFAIAPLREGEVRILNPDVVEKSFASFWEQLPKLGLHCRREGNVMVVNRQSDLFRRKHGLDF